MKYFHILTLSLVALSITSCGQGVNGAGRAVLQNKGSDTLVNVAQAWAEHYSEVNPSIAVAVTGGGSGTGISSMINGTVDIANSSRAMKERELEAQGLLATCIQHEIDHLEGVLFVDHLTSLKRNIIIRKLQKTKKTKAAAE